MVPFPTLNHPSDFGGPRKYILEFMISTYVKLLLSIGGSLMLLTLGATCLIDNYMPFSLILASLFVF